MPYCRPFNELYSPWTDYAAALHGHSPGSIELKGIHLKGFNYPNEWPCFDLTRRFQALNVLGSVRPLVSLFNSEGVC